ncbi:MAG: hypothetical protein EOM20_06460 [Spartobacteria bacterium]|nr:hypothetical protein [Spartobacteria bacterium]
MRRRSSGDISSFDLLLDTMCNTFGGIVFIALLLAILVGATNRNVEEPTQTEGPSLSEVEALAEETRLSGDCVQLRKTIQALDPLSAPEANRDLVTVQQLAELLSTNVLMASKQAELTEQQHLLEREIYRFSELARNATVSAVDLQEQIQRLKEDLRQQRARATKKVRLPRIRPRPGMRACFFAIAGGRFYCVSDVTRASAYGDRGYDTQDVILEQGAGQDIAEIIKGAGQLIQPGCENRGKLAAALQNCDTDNELIHFCVRRDSFAEFNYVKELFVSRGFSYNWGINDGAIQIIIVTDDLEAQ